MNNLANSIAPNFSNKVTAILSSYSGGPVKDFV